MAGSKYITEAQADSMYASMIPTTVWIDSGIEGFTLYDVWADSDTVLKEGALTEATLYIDSYEYNGRKTVNSQDKEFPRNGDIVVPNVIKQVCFEIALLILEAHIIKTLNNPLTEIAKQSGMREYRSTIGADTEWVRFETNPDYQEDKLKNIMRQLKKYLKGRFSIVRYVKRGV